MGVDVFAFVDFITIMGLFVWLNGVDARRWQDNKNERKEREREKKGRGRGKGVWSAAFHFQFISPPLPPLFEYFAETFAMKRNMFLVVVLWSSFNLYIRDGEEASTYGVCLSFFIWV